MVDIDSIPGDPSVKNLVYIIAVMGGLIGWFLVRLVLQMDKKLDAVKSPEEIVTLVASHFHTKDENKLMEDAAKIVHDHMSTGLSEVKIDVAALKRDTLIQDTKILGIERELPIIRRKLHYFSNCITRIYAFMKIDPPPPDSGV